MTVTITRKPDLLITDYALSRIHYQINRWSQKIQPSDIDDMRQEIFLSLLLVADEYDESVASMETFVSMQINNAVNRFAASLYRIQKRESNSFEFLREDELPVYNESRKGDVSQLDLIYWKIDLDSAMQKHLSKRQSRICKMFLHGLVARDIAYRLKISTSQMQRDMDSVIGDLLPVYIVAVEKKEPYRCGVWQLTAETLLTARAENEAAIERYKRSRDEDFWPTGYEEMRYLAIV